MVSEKFRFFASTCNWLAEKLITVFSPSGFWAGTFSSFLFCSNNKSASRFDEASVASPFVSNNDLSVVLNEVSEDS